MNEVRRSWKGVGEGEEIVEEEERLSSESRWEGESTIV